MNTIPKTQENDASEPFMTFHKRNRRHEEVKKIVLLMRLHKPIGIYLLFWPSCWGLLAASFPQLPSWRYICLFGLGAIFMRSFGCIINDLWDGSIDGFVKRTQERPLPSHLMGYRRAFLVAMLLGIASFLILLQLNPMAITVGLFIVPFVIIYPYMKQVTYGAQFILGITFSWGVLLGWSCVTGNFPTYTAFCLYGVSALWIVAYDTIYGWQDSEDDFLLGLKSTSLLWRSFPKKSLCILYGGVLLLLSFFGFLQTRGVIFYGSLILIGLYCTFQVKNLDIHKSSLCLRAFKSVNWIQGILAMALLFDAINYVSMNDFISIFIQRAP